MAEPRRPKVADIRHARAKQRRKEWLSVFRSTGSLNQAHAAVGCTPGTYRNWRAKYPEFRLEVDALKAELRNESIKSGTMTAEQWEIAGFVERRRHFFGMVTPKFQMMLIEQYLNTPPGNIEMQLVAPEHGKTTLFEDYATDKLAVDPSHRFTVGSERQDLATKIINRCRTRMDPMGPTPEFVKIFGPFVPQTRTRGGNTYEESMTGKQPWGSKFFSVFKKKSFDERDYSMEARGINGQIAGTRTDHMHLDDVQSLNNINETEKIVNKFRQDWLSRPGETGHITIAGTRVREDDFYAALIEDDALDDSIMHVSKFPAIIRNEDGDEEPLWPEKWPLDKLERMRKKVGEEAWWRNWMQRPKAATLGTFTEDMVMKCANPMRAIEHDPDPEDGPLIIGWDPSIGGINCFVVCQMCSDHLRILFVKEQEGLVNNQQLFRELEELLIRFTVRGCVVSDVVIEATHFQKGLVKDQDLLHLRKRFGFAIHGHVTGKNKYDANIGIPAMATDFYRQAIEFPWADDRRTRGMFEDWTHQLVVWRPDTKGSRLRMDQVMATWFAWLVWSRRRRGTLKRTSEIQGEGLGYTPTKALVLNDGKYAYV